MDLQELDTPRPKTRWIKLHGHLEGVELLVRLASPKDGRRFHNKLVRAGIVKDTRENPFDVATGREADFFRELAAMYVLDWRGDIKPKDTPYSPEVMGKVLGAYRRAFDRLMEVIAEEDDFFGDAPSA